MRCHALPLVVAAAAGQSTGGYPAHDYCAEYKTDPSMCASMEIMYGCSYVDKTAAAEASCVQVCSKLTEQNYCMAPNCEWDQNRGSCGDAAMTPPPPPNCQDTRTEWNDCANYMNDLWCPRSCSRQSSTTGCTSYCKAACQCTQQYVLRESSGECVAEDECTCDEARDATTCEQRATAAGVHCQWSQSANGVAGDGQCSETTPVPPPTPTDCGEQRKQAMCTGVSGCTWVTEGTGYCAKTCVSYVNYADCPQDRCQVDSLTMECTEKPSTVMCTRPFWVRLNKNEGADAMTRPEWHQWCGAICKALWPHFFRGWCNKCAAKQETAHLACP